MTDASDSFPEAEPPTHRDKLADPARLEALEKTGLMDSMEETAFNRAVRVAIAATGAPVSLVSLVDDRRQFFKAQMGLQPPVKDARETPLSHSFCQYVTTEDRELAVTDARQHPLLKKNGAVEDLKVIAYLGYPIHAPDGQPLGSFCVIHDKPHEWAAREKEIVSGIAQMLEVELALRAEMATTTILLKEMAHRVGNLFAVILGMVKMTARTASTVEGFRDALQGRIYGLQQAHDLAPPKGMEEGDVDGSVPLQTLIGATSEPYLQHQQAHLTMGGPAMRVGPKAANNLALAVNEIMSNAAKFGALSVPEGEISISWVAGEEIVHLVVTERGGPEVCGRPSQSGFGTSLMDMTINGPLGGQVNIDWQPEGVTYKLQLKKSLLAE